MAATVAVAPPYPPIAIQARVQGTVILVLNIDASGTPRGVTVKSGLPFLTDSAREAVRAWRFPPGSARSQEVAFEFTLSDDDERGQTAPRVQFEAPNKMTVTAQTPLVCACGPKGGVCYREATVKPR